MRNPSPAMLVLFRRREELSNEVRRAGNRARTAAEELSNEEALLSRHQGELADIDAAIEALQYQAERDTNHE